MKVYKPVVLSISSLQIMALVVMTPVVSKIASEFPGTNEGLIKAMITLPAFCILIFSQLSGWLASFASKKKLVLLGLALYFIGGLSTYFTVNIYQMMLCRLIVGIGIGFFMPMTTGLVADFYTGTERTRTIGYSQAINYFGGVVATLLAGYIAAFEWRNVFLIYAFAGIVFIVIAFGLPEQERKERAAPKYYILPKVIYFYGICVLLQLIVFYSCVTNTAVRLKEMGVDNTVISSLGVSILYLGCFITGTQLVKILALFKQRTVFLAIALSASGFLLIGLAQAELLFFAGMAIVGIADGVIIPYLFSAAAKYSPREANGQTMATIIFFMGLGQFLSPLLFQLAIRFLGRNTVYGGFLGMSGLILLAAFIALFISVKHRKVKIELI